MLKTGKERKEILKNAKKFSTKEKKLNSQQKKRKDKDRKSKEKEKGELYFGSSSIGYAELSCATYADVS
jgi:hypothetical protein